jgi:hypothetical protein
VISIAAGRAADDGSADAPSGERCGGSQSGRRLARRPTTSVSAGVAVMEPADLRDGHHTPERGRLHLRADEQGAEERPETDYDQHGATPPSGMTSEPGLYRISDGGDEAATVARWAADHVWTGTRVEHR